MKQMEIKISEADNRTTIAISGIIDEHADLSQLTALEGRLEFDLGEVRRFNSVGVRIWVDAIRALTGKANLTFVQCPPVVIDQLNMIQGFLANGTVRSFYGAMVCPHCDEETMELFDAASVRHDDRLPPVKCPSCKLAMELDDIEDQFLLFIREPTVVRLP